jgi:4a-hydroxytetrahydrobiopterin dehydratase
MKTLSEEKLKQLLESEREWKLVDGALVRDWTFPDFVAAMQFVNRVAALAEAVGHHPDIDIRYSRVRLALISHDAGGITERDADMAKRMASV